jgi:PAS domain S-box-containing protein
MTRVKSFSISRKITAFLAVLLVVYALVEGIFGFALYMSDNTEAYANTALTIAKSAGVRSGDLVHIEEIKPRLAELTDSTDATAVYILGLSESRGGYIEYPLLALGNAEISTGTTIKASALPPEIRIAVYEGRAVVSRVFETYSEKIITGFVPVFDDDDAVVAIVCVDISTEKLYRGAFRYALRETLISLVLIIILITIGYFVAGWVFGRRMRLISDAAEKIASGNFDVSLSTGTGKFPVSDEADVIARNLQVIGNVINTIAAGIPGYESRELDNNGGMNSERLTGIFTTIEQTIHKLMSIIENIDSLVYVSDIETYELLYANRRLLEQMGLSAAEIEGKKCWELIHKANKPCAFCPVQRLMADKSNAVYEREYYNEADKKWYLMQDSLIRWADGRTAHFEIATDVTKLKTYEEQMKYLSAIISTSDAGIIVNDRRGLIQEWNVGAARILGYEREEVIGKSPKEFNPPESYSFIENTISRIVAGEHIHHPEEMRRHKDGRRVFCSITYTPILDDKGLASGYVSVFHDVSERVKSKKLQEDALHEAVLNAAETSRLKSMFLANMSHEIRTPMNGIIGLTELALEGGGLSEKTTDYLTKIQTSATGLLVIINDILDISKIEAGKAELENVAFTFGDVFKSCEVISELKKKAGNVKLIFDCGELAGEVVIGDPTKLRQILMNLLSNAIKFTNKGSVELTAVLESREQDSFTVTFAVRDTGIGMDEKQVQRALEPFVQADASTTRKYGGTGLGLSITNSLLEMMGGGLVVESEPGVGSTFSFTLTFKAAGKSVPVVVHFDDEYRENEKKKPIFAAEALICEDNSINIQVIEEHLLRIGIKSVVAENGKIGVNMAKTRMRIGKPFDIILMDIHMPVMDGLEAMQKLIEAGSETPVVAMTANAMREDRELVLQSGMSDYICKPFTARDLWNCLLRFLKPVRFEDVTQSSAAGEKGEIIDGRAGLEKSAGDPGLYKKIKTDFYFKNRNTIEMIEHAVSCKDFTTAHRLAHTLKGVAVLIGASRLGEAALAVEKFYADGVADRQALGLVKEQLEAVLEELSGLAVEAREADEKEKSKVTVTNIVKAFDIISRLEPLLKEGSSEATDFTDEIKAAFSKEQCEELILYILDYEFDEALQELLKIKKQLEGE